MGSGGDRRCGVSHRHRDRPAAGFRAAVLGAADVVIVGAPAALVPACIVAIGALLVLAYETGDQQ